MSPGVSGRPGLAPADGRAVLPTVGRDRSQVEGAVPERGTFAPSASAACAEPSRMVGNHVQGAAGRQTQSGTPADPERLDQHDCWDLPRRGTVKRPAVVVDGDPDIFSINSVVDHGTIVFRADAGKRLSAAAKSTGGVRDGQLPHRGWRGLAWRRPRSRRRDPETDDVIDAMGLPLVPWQEGSASTLAPRPPGLVAGVDQRRPQHGGPIGRPGSGPLLVSSAASGQGPSVRALAAHVVMIEV